MRFELHPAAVAAFNAKANEFKDAVRIKPPSPKAEPAGYTPDVPIGFQFSAEHLLGPIEVFQSDRHGNRVSRFVDEGGRVVGLEEHAYPHLIKLAKSIQKTGPFRNTVSVRFIEDALFKWCLETFQRRETSAAIDFVVHEAEQKVRPIEVWVPIYALHIQSEFSIGPVRFKTITREVVDAWQQGIREKTGGDPAIAFDLDRRRKEIQGLAAAAAVVDAEQVRAVELASELADTAASLLRLFAPANFDPRELSFCVPLGSHERVGYHYFIVENGRITRETRGVIPRGTNPWVIDDAALREIQAAGLAQISALSAKDPKTQLEQTVFDALLLYSKAALVPYTSEKLLYMFAALESVLLRNASEPITRNVAERVAFLAGTGVDSRVQITKLVTEAYAVRAAFVHHGERRDDYDLTGFMMCLWDAMHTLVGNATRFQTKEELLDAIERHKFR